MSKEKPLQGKTYEISMMYLRYHIGEILLKIQMGATYVLLHGKNEKPVAVLQGLPGERLTMNIAGDGRVSYTA